MIERKKPEEFDQFADTYNDLLEKQLSVLNRDIGYFAEYKIAKVFSKTEAFPRKILDFGCGTGRSIPYLKKYFPDSKISGCDVSVKSLRAASKNFPYADFYLVSELALQKNQPKFDLVLAAGILHHIPINERHQTLKKIASLMDFNADLFIFEQNPLNPVTKYFVNTCPFDENASLLKRKDALDGIEQSGMEVKSSGYTLFFPGFLKPLRRFEPYLEWLPLGGQYYIHAVNKPLRA
ncbi:MAG: class I SAM-dependent methyltransferase [Desulfobacterales bacterium]|nr:class I SAM-dependent methyltransferase [Desulfobacterales bacterium]